MHYPSKLLFHSILSIIKYYVQILSRETLNEDIVVWLWF